jgi:energy-coupling factor transport system permease protein
MARAAAIAYARRPTALGAARATVAAAFGVSIAFAALFVQHPLMLGALLACVLIAGVQAQCTPAMALTLRWTLVPLVLTTVIINALVSREGLTVLARLGDWGAFGQVDVTLEAVVYGLVYALRLVIVALAFVLVYCNVDTDELLVASRRLAPRSALAALLGTRLMPVLADDARRLAQAQRCRPEPPSKTRGRLLVVRAAVRGAIDRSLDSAAVLEMRGFAESARPGRRRDPRSRHDIAFIAASAVIILAAVLSNALPGNEFATYPTISWAVTPALLVLCAAVVLAGSLPFAARRGVRA